MVNAFDFTAGVVRTPSQPAPNCHRVAPASFGENPDLLIFPGLRSRAQARHHRVPGRPAIQPGDYALFRETGGVMMSKAGGSSTFWRELA